MAYTDTFPILGNFIETNLTSDVMASDTTIYLIDTERLPDIITGRDHIPCVLRSASSEYREIVYVTAVNHTKKSVTVTRGMEGTEARNWEAMTYFYCTLTAFSAERMRINEFSPLLNDTGERPTITWINSNSFSIPGDYRKALEVNMAVRIISGKNVVAPTDSKYAIHVTAVSYASSKTTVTVRNAVLPTTLSGVDTGIMTSAAPMYTPSTVVADEKTLTQTGNVISAKTATATTKGIVDGNDIITFAKSAILNAVYPKGAIYISTVATSPASLFGGTWEALGGRFLIGANTSYAAGGTGGEATHKLVKDEIPSYNMTVSTSGTHTHTRGSMEITGGGLWWEHPNYDVYASQLTGAFYVNMSSTEKVGSNSVDRDNRQIDFKASRSWTGETSTSGSHTHTVSTGGGGKAHNNMPPYLVVYMWKRTA